MSTAMALPSGQGHTGQTFLRGDRGVINIGGARLSALREDTLPTGHALQAESPIVVAVLHAEPLVGAGVAATLSNDPGFEVQVAGDSVVGESGANLLKRLTGVDVVIADYDGALAIAQAQRNSAGPLRARAAKILIVSQLDGEADVRHALQQGIRGYFTLGSRADEMVESVVALHRGQRRISPSVARRVAESFDYEALTGRELDVLRRVAAGEGNKEIAQVLGIALKTVKTHLGSIMGKLGAKTRTEAAAIARRRGLFAWESQCNG